ncbi:MAG: hypothetical protein LBS20_11720 [Prevotella sp.]|jgi:hypothetical protein|nr:hypothetical protein [Prevotella sp.]
MTTNPTSTLKLSYLSTGGFPEDIFLRITGAIPDTAGLDIRVMNDEIACGYKKEYLFKDGKWCFEALPDTDTTPESILTRYPCDKAIFTTGAYIERISYVNSSGKTVFGWIVNGFEHDTYCDGDYIDVTSYGTFLDALTPPADDEERKTEYIVRSLQSYGLQRIELRLYKAILKEENSAVYVRKLDSITQAGQLTQIESTLDEFLLNCPNFSQTTREILVDTFGRNRLDIFITPENVLVIGSCRANIWTVQENGYNDLKKNEN